MPGQLPRRGERGRGAGQPAEEQVAGDVGPPRRLLQHRPAVVGAEVGLRHHLLLPAPPATSLHARPATPTRISTAAMPATATTTPRHIPARARANSTSAAG